MQDQQTQLYELSRTLRDLAPISLLLYPNNAQVTSLKFRALCSFMEVEYGILGSLVVVLPKASAKQLVIGGD